MLADEVQIFAERNRLLSFALDSEGVARQAMDGVGDVTLDVSFPEKPCLHVLVPCEHPTPPLLLRGLQLCDPARLVGMAMNFVADSGGRIGFLILLPSKQLYADIFGIALAQILQALIHTQQG